MKSTGLTKNCSIQYENYQSSNIHKISFTPENHGPCEVQLTFNDKAIPGFPLTVDVRKESEPELVRVVGAGVEGPVSASLPATFTVDARDAGMGELTLGITVSYFLYYQFLIFWKFKQ